MSTLGGYTQAFSQVEEGGKTGALLIRGRRSGVKGKGGEKL